MYLKAKFVKDFLNKYKYQNYIKANMFNNEINIFVDNDEEEIKNSNSKDKLLFYINDSKRYCTINILNKDKVFQLKFLNDFLEEVKKDTKLINGLRYFTFKNNNNEILYLNSHLDKWIDLFSLNKMNEILELAINNNEKVIDANYISARTLNKLSTVLKKENMKNVVPFISLLEKHNAFKNRSLIEKSNFIKKFYLNDDQKNFLSKLESFKDLNINKLDEVKSSNIILNNIELESIVLSSKEIQLFLMKQEKVESASDFIKEFIKSINERLDKDNVRVSLSKTHVEKDNDFFILAWTKNDHIILNNMKIMIEKTLEDVIISSINNIDKIIEKNEKFIKFENLNSQLNNKNEIQGIKKTKKI